MNDETYTLAVSEAIEEDFGSNDEAIPIAQMKLKGDRVASHECNSAIFEFSIRDCDPANNFQLF